MDAESAGKCGFLVSNRWNFMFWVFLAPKSLKFVFWDFSENIFFVLFEKIWIKFLDIFIITMSEFKTNINKNNFWKKIIFDLKKINFKININ